MHGALSLPVGYKNMKPFKKKCPNCGKETVNYDPNKVAFCSKACETNYKYSNKFQDSRYWQNTPVKDNET